jgi:hypothetical protein
MTWKEFVERAEAKMRELRVPENAELDSVSFFAGFGDTLQVTLRGTESKNRPYMSICN